MAVCSATNYAPKDNFQRNVILDETFPMKFTHSSPFAQFVLCDIQPIQNRDIFLTDALGYPTSSSSVKKVTIKKNSIFAKEYFYQYKGQSSLTSKSTGNSQLNPKSLLFSSKKIKKPLKENKEYLLHKLKLFIRDRFVEKAIACVRGMSRELLHKNTRIAKQCLLECLLSEKLEDVALALLEKSTFSIFDVPIIGPSLEYNVYPCFFVVCIALGRDRLVEKILSGKKKSIIADYSWFNIPSIVFCCFSNSTPILKLLCQCGADPAAVANIDDLMRINDISVKKSLNQTVYFDCKEIYSFEISAMLNNLESVNFLLNKIQRCNVFKNSSCSLLLQANSVISLILIRAGVSVGQQNRYKQLGLHLAVTKGNIELVCIYLNFGLAVNSVDVFGNTALHYAAIFKEKEIFLFLVYKGADASIKNNNLLTPYEIALNNGVLKIGESSIMERELALEIETNVIELIQNPQYDSIVKFKKGFKLNEKLFGPFSRALSFSKTCPPLKNSSPHESFSTCSPNNEHTISRKYSLLNSLTSIFRRKGSK